MRFWNDQVFENLRIMQKEKKFNVLFNFAGFLSVVIVVVAIVMAIVMVMDPCGGPGQRRRWPGSQSCQSSIGAIVTR